MYELIKISNEGRLQHNKAFLFSKKDIYPSSLPHNSSMSWLHLPFALHVTFLTEGFSSNGS